MKLLVATLILGTAGLAANAQDTTPPAAPVAVAPAKVLAELAASSGPFRNNPFTADEANESVQVLADGNRIVHSSTGKVYRNSEGRTRRETKGGVGGNLFNYTYSFPTPVSIIDPAIGQKVLLDEQAKVARIAELNAAQGVTVISGNREATEEERAKLAARLKELQATAANVQAAAAVLSTAQVPPIAPMAPMAPITINMGQMKGEIEGQAVRSRYETHREELGTRDFGGVSADGTKTTTTIPAGAVGNERPIEIVYERWYSKELGVVVYSKRIDPRTGEQTYELTNIVRTEPDPSLFNIPREYRKVGQSGVLLRTTTARPVAVKSTAAITPKAARP